MSIYEYDVEKHERTLREEGREEGSALTLVRIVCKKLIKHQTISEIADALEEEPAVIKQIVEAAEPFAPFYDAEKVAVAYMGQMKTRIDT